MTKQSSTSSAASAAATAASCEDLLRQTFGNGVVDPAAVAAACSPDIEWDDFAAAGPVRVPGPPM